MENPIVFTLQLQRESTERCNVPYVTGSKWHTTEVLNFFSRNLHPSGVLKMIKSPVRFHLVLNTKHFGNVLIPIILRIELWLAIGRDCILAVHYAQKKDSSIRIVRKGKVVNP